MVIDDSAMFGYDHPKLHELSRAARCAGDEPDLDWLEAQRRRAVSPRTRPSSSTPPARPDIRRARWSPTASISPRPTTVVDALSDAAREGAPHGGLPAALPRARPRRRGHAAADLAAGAAFRRRSGGFAGDAVRDRRRRCCSPCRAICRNSPSQVLVGVLNSLTAQARGLRAARCALRARTSAAAGTAARAPRRKRSIARCRRRCSGRS